MPAPLDDILGSTGVPEIPAAKPAIPSPQVPPAAPPVPVTPSFREFSDYPSIRKDIFDNVLSSVQTKFPMENTRYQLRVAGLSYKDPKDFSLADQKKAIMRGESLHWPLHGTWELVDKASQKVVDQKASVIAHVPYITNRGTFIYNGSEYSVANQMRMKPGVFARVKENGFVEAHVNVKPGTGPSMRIHMEPETAIFRVEVGQSNLKLYPILKAMGISDKDLEKNWGREILQKNIAAEDPRAVSRAFAKLVSTRADQAVGGDDEASLFKMSSVTGELDLPPWLVAAGDVTDYVTDRALLLALKKLQNEKEEYRIPRHDKNKLLASVLEKTSEDTLPDVVPGGQGDKLSVGDVDIDQLVMGMETELEHTDNEELALDIAKDHLSEDPKYYAKLQKMEKKAKLDAAASDRRWTQLWYTGQIEASKHNDDEWVLLTVHRGLCEASYESLKAEGVACSPKFSNPHISVLRPEEVAELKKKFGNAWKGAAKVGQKFRFKLKRIVSLIPAGWSDKYDRVWFLECESPDLNKLRKDLGFYDLPRNPESGNDMRFHITFAVHSNTVKEACDLLMEKRAAMSATTPSTTLTPAPAVKDNSGQQLLDVFSKMELDPDVTEATLGQRFTNMNIPTLLRTTQKLLNVNAGKEDTDDRDSLAFQTLHSSEDFFPERIKKDAGQISRKMLWRATTKGNVQSIPSGVLTPQLSGVLLKSGLGMPLEEINPIDAYDQSIRILRLGEGGISSVQAIPEEARSVQPSHFGFIDPVRAPECHDEKTEVMTDKGWVLWSDVSSSTKFACLVEGKLEFHLADRLIAEPYKGKMIGAKTRMLDFLVTPNHRMWVRPQSSKAKHYVPVYRFEPADNIVDSVRLFLCGGHAATPGTITSFVLPSVEAEGLDRQVHGNPPIGNKLINRKDPINIKDWCAFLGWYLAEGSTSGTYVVKISQLETANPEKCKSIGKLLDRLPFSWSFNGKDFSICGKQLNAYCSQFGYCDDKYIPAEVFEAPPEARLEFIDALLQGDGRRDRSGVIRTLCTTSARLAADFERLAFSVGLSTTKHFEKDERQERYLGCHTVRVCYHTERLVTNRSPRHPDGQYVVENYDGKVYCATVPGGLLFTRRNNSVGMWSGNSSKMGIDSRVTHRTKKGKDGNFYTDMTDARTGKPVTISAAQASRSIVAFPGEMAREGNKVRAMINSRRVGFVDKSKVDFELPDPVQMFTATSNLVPLTSGIKGGRLLMGAKYFVQSLPLKNPEVPLVQNLADPKTGASFDDLYGDRVGAIKSDDSGVVVDIGGDYIKVKYANGETKSHEMYQNFPFNRKSSIHNTPVVKIGDPVAKGQVLAKSNYTDDKGSLAMGTNLRTAYMIYKGHNYEDATVISESAAKRLSSERMYQNLTDPDHNVDKNAYVSMYPTKFNKTQMATIDKSGVVKPGTIVRYGDPLTLALQKNEVTAVHRSHKPVWGDSALTWGHEYEGVVTDVDKTKEGAWNVTVKAYVPAQEGDKLAGRYGDKGVIAKILPDDQMPHDKEGKPFEILLNPLGVISRGNPSQVMEALLGKVARKTGSAYKLPSFRQGSWIDFVEGELKKHGLSDTEDLIDPITGKKVPKIMTGERFMLKLHHTAESKGRGRDVGAYTSEGIPARGGELGSKRVSTMEQYSLLSHGATEVLRDAQVVRGQRNDDYWRAFRMGMTPPSPKVPFIYDKFLSSMRGAGINVKKDGNRIHLFALTDKDIDEMSHGPLQTSDTVRSSDMKELDGGLFDRKKTGGHNGEWWSHIDLVEPMPNPVMEEPVRNLLGLTQKRYEEILSGKDTIGGKSGGEAIREALARINIDSAIQQAQTTIQDGKKTKRDAAVKQLGYLKGLKKYGLEPKDLVLTKVPVLPPNMRPITAFQGMTMTADANVLYKDLMLANNSLGRLKGKVDDASLGEERLQLYNSFKAASGLGDPVQAKTLEKGVKGLLAHVFGVGSPKTGLFQRRVLGSPVDVVGRATITPNPELDMDQVGLPEDKAWTIYRPFITRRLVRRGMPATEAARAVADRSEVAKRAMLEEMGERPVLINRAPTLHRYGFMASWPVLTKNDTLQMSPVVTNGFTADFDGDAMNYHVPVTDEAVKEAIEKMMPSKNLKAVKDFKVHYMPRNEFLLGLYLASSADNKNEPRVFKDKKSALDSYRRGELDLGDRIVIKD